MQSVIWRKTLFFNFLRFSLPITDLLLHPQQKGVSHVAIRPQRRHHHVVCLTTGTKPLAKRVLQRQRSSAPSFKFQYVLPSLSLYHKCLRFLPRLPAPPIFPAIFPSITCFEGSSYVICHQFRLKYQIKIKSSVLKIRLWLMSQQDKNKTTE